MSKLKKGNVFNNRGAAMIAALCIMAIFVTLCLSMLLTSSVLMHKAQNRLYEEQCKISAVSMSKELEYDLCSDKTSDFYAYITREIDIENWANWPYLNTDELNHGEQSPKIYRDYTVSDGTDISGSTGEVTARMYWEFGMGGAVSDVFLHVEVTANKSGEAYTVKSVYNPQEAVDGSWFWSIYERS